MENMDKRKFRNGMIIYLLILIVAFILINRWMQSDKIEVTTTYSYTDLTEDLDRCPGTLPGTGHHCAGCQLPQCAGCNPGDQLLF